MRGLDIQYRNGSGISSFMVQVWSPFNVLIFCGQQIVKLNDLKSNHRPMETSICDMCIYLHQPLSTLIYSLMYICNRPCITLHVVML